MILLFRRSFRQKDLFTKALGFRGLFFMDSGPFCSKIKKKTGHISKMEEKQFNITDSAIDRYGDWYFRIWYGERYRDVFGCDANGPDPVMEVIGALGSLCLGSDSRIYMDEEGSFVQFDVKCIGESYVRLRFECDGNLKRIGSPDKPETLEPAQDFSDDPPLVFECDCPKNFFVRLFYNAFLKIKPQLPEDFPSMQEEIDTIEKYLEECSHNQKDVNDFYYDDTDEQFGALRRTRLHNTSSIPEIRELVCLGADVNIFADDDNPEGLPFSPLAYALATGDTEKARELIRLGARLDFTGNLPLVHAVNAAFSKSGTDILEFALKELKCGINDFRKGFRTALTAAAENEDIEVCSWLLSQGAEINGHDGLGDTPLTVSLSCPETASFLIRRGANVNKCRSGTDEDAPLHIAAGLLQKRIVKKLLKNGADPNILNTRGETPIFRAIRSENGRNTAELAKTLKILIRHNADINIKGPGLKTPLYYALSHDKMISARLLSDYGARVSDKAEKDGDLLKIFREKRMNWQVGAYLRLHFLKEKGRPDDKTTKAALRRILKTAEIVLKAYRSGKCISFDYRDAYGEATRRTVRPEEISETGFSGYCFLRSDERHFLFRRMSAVVTEKK